jgi:hypothetical protein
MKRVNFRRVLIVAGLMSLVIVYVLLWSRMLSSHEERTGSDFISAYTAGRVADLWGGAHVYDLARQQAVQAEVVGFDLAPGQVLMFNHPPYLVPLLAVLMDGDYVASLVRYALLMTFLYGASLLIAWHLLKRDGWPKNDAPWRWQGWQLFPLFVNLLNTQDTAFMVVGALLVLLGLLTDRDWLAGLGLALTSVRPHVTLVMTSPFLFRRQKVFFWFVLFATGLAAIAWMAVGWQGIQAYLQILLTAAGGTFYGLQEAAMVNLVGWLTRHAPALPVTVNRVIGWAAYLASLLALCLIWRRSRYVDERHWGWTALMAVFFVPHLHYHDLALLLVPVLSLMLVSVRGKWLTSRQVALLPLVMSLALLISNFSLVLKADFPALVMLLLALALWYVGYFFSLPKRETHGEM